MIILVCMIAGMGLLAESIRRKATDGTLDRRVALAGAVMLMIAAALLLTMSRYSLVKTIGRLMMPAGVLWLSMMVAAAICWSRNLKHATAVTCALWVLCTVAGNHRFASSIVSGLEAPYRDIDVMQEGGLDVVHVLGGGTSGSNGHYRLGASGGRVMLGARIYYAGGTPLLLTSGSAPPGRDGRPGHDSAAATTAIWTDIGIPESAIIQMPAPRNTRDEAAMLRELARERGWQRVGVVTSAWHMRRATRLLRDTDFEVVPLPADFISDGRGGLPRSFAAWIPGGDGFFMSHRAGWEILGSLAGR